jgi:hypothetical protein
MSNIVYIATNRAFPSDWIKIGMTNTTVEQRMRELSASTSIPTSFECYYAAEVNDAGFVEKQLHSVFADTRINTRKEFFQLEPRIAKAALSIGAVKDVTPVPMNNLFEEGDNITIPGHKWDAYDIPIGAELTYARDSNKKAKVVGVKKLEYEGEVYSLHSLSNKLIKEIGIDTQTVVGSREWLYQGEMLQTRGSRD